MEQLMVQQPLLGTPHIGFISLIIVGGLAGWIAGMVLGARHGMFTNILVGIAGSYVGSKIAELIDIRVAGTLMHLVIAFAGSVIVLTIWRMIHPQSSLNRP